MPSRIKAPLAGCLACALALLALALLAYVSGPGKQFDAALVTHLDVDSSATSGRAARAIVRLADPLPLLVMTTAICALALSRGRRREALAAVAVVAGANVTTQLLKAVLAHPRYQLENLSEPLTAAFPSGHATAAGSIAVALILAVPDRLRPPAALAGAAFAAAVGACLVLLHAHFASDVLGGYLVAAGWGFAALAALRLAQPAAVYSQAAPEWRNWHTRSTQNRLP